MPVTLLIATLLRQMQSTIVDMCAHTQTNINSTCCPPKQTSTMVIAAHYNVSLPPDYQILTESAVYVDSVLSLMQFRK